MTKNLANPLQTSCPENDTTCNFQLDRPRDKTVYKQQFNECDLSILPVFGRALGSTL